MERKRGSEENLSPAQPYSDWAFKGMSAVLHTCKAGEIDALMKT